MLPAGKRLRHAASSGSVRSSNWSPDQDKRLSDIVAKHGAKEWKIVAYRMNEGSEPLKGGKGSGEFGGEASKFSDVQCLHRWNKVLKPGLKKGLWTEEEDSVVLEMVQRHGVGNIKWSEIAERLPGRIGKQCRERWFNHLDTQVNKTDW